MKFGPSDGNSGAIIRWGKKLDNGIWIRRWIFHRLWTKWRFSQGYVNFGIILFRWVVPFNIALKRQERLKLLADKTL